MAHSVSEKFYPQAGHLLGTFRTEGRRSVNSIETLGKVLLVAENGALHMLSADNLDILWTANSNTGLLRYKMYKELFSFLAQKCTLIHRPSFPLSSIFALPTLY